MRSFTAPIVGILCCLPFFCYAQNSSSNQTHGNDPYQSFSELPPDDDEAPPRYPASGSGPITPPS